MLRLLSLLLIKNDRFLKHFKDMNVPGILLAVFVQ